MLTLKTLKSVNTISDLEELNLGRVDYSIGGRGGYVGFYSTNIAAHFKVDADLLPRKFGAGSNYLGGGVRGDIFPSDFDTRIEGRKRQLLEALAQACVRAYKAAEDDAGMNDEVDEDGEINWEAKATNGARNAGIRSAY